MTVKSATSVDLSIVVTAHAEGILLHKTMASIRRALKPLHNNGVSTEIIIHCDNPKPATINYLKTQQSLAKEATIYTNQFGDLGSSRNFGVSKARGKYVTFIDADDLMSSDWLINAYDFLESQPFGEYIAHSELTVEFGGANSLVIKHGEIDQSTDTLLSVFANRWNSIIMAPRSLLLEEPYTPNSPGYGYEDWHLNCRFIARGIHNVLVPNTVIFVRRKEANSEWLRQKLSYSVLPSNTLFSFDRIRELPLTQKPDSDSAVIFPPSTLEKIKNRLVPAIKRVPGAEHYARKVYQQLRQTTTQKPITKIPAWLVEEWRAMHSIDKLLFPSPELLSNLPIYDSLTPEHFKTGEAYKRLVDHTTANTYNYILFVPWLVQGGADLFAINYANAIKAEQPQKNVLVISTLPTQSIWNEKLVDVDFMPFGAITESLSQDIKFRLLEQIIENSGAEHIHILNSELAYDFVAAHEHYMISTQKKLIVTSFSQSTDHSGRIFGYSHTHVPTVYEQTTAITTDNNAVAEMWQAEYGFDPSKILIHHQPMTIEESPLFNRPVIDKPLRILWAARLSNEKQPALVAEIGKLLADSGITIDMYGQPDESYNVSFLQALPSNVSYKGPFNGLSSIPLNQYDAYLYTSLFDGMPNTVLEVANAGLPIVSSRVGGVPEFITDHVSGLLVDNLQSAEDYAAAIRELQANPKELTTYAEKLHRELINKHSREAYKTEIKAFLKLIGY